jgi:MFS family permease
MSEKLNLKSAESKVFRATINDGLWEIFIAGVALQFSVAPLLSPTLGDFWSTAIFVPFLVILLIVIWLIRKYIVKPRTGVVKFGKQRIGRLKKFTLVMLTINILAFILGLIASFYFRTLSGQIIAIMFGLILLAGFSLAGYFLDYSRLYVYGFLLGIAPFVGEWLYSNYGASHHGFPITFGFISGVVFLAGLFTFVRFLRRNPIETNASTQG